MRWEWTCVKTSQGLQSYLEKPVNLHTWPVDLWKTPPYITDVLAPTSSGRNAQASLSITDFWTPSRSSLGKLTALNGSKTLPFIPRMHVSWINRKPHVYKARLWLRHKRSWSRPTFTEVLYFVFWLLNLVTICEVKCSRAHLAVMEHYPGC